MDIVEVRKAYFGLVLKIPALLLVVLIWDVSVVGRVEDMESSCDMIVGLCEDCGGTLNSCDDDGVNIRDIISCGGSLENVDSKKF